MAVNKVVINTENGEEVLMDLTNDTVTAEMLAEGVTAHGANGELIVGTMGFVKKYQGTENVGKILVVGADGNLCLIDMPETMVGDVFGFVDENNTIILTGNISDGEYTVKYEMEDGTIIDIGDLTIGDEEPTVPTYTNQIPISTDASGNLFVGTNGEKGYKTGYRLSMSSGGETAADGYECTGFIPVKENDVVRIKNIDVTQENSTNIIGYDANKNPYNAGTTSNYGQPLGTVFVTKGTKDGDVYAVTLNGTIYNAFGSGLAYIRIGSKSITDESIITVNQEIVEQTNSYTNFADPTSSDWKVNYRLTTNIDQVTNLPGGAATNYIDVQNGDVLEVTGINFEDTNNRIAWNFGTNYASISKASALSTSFTGSFSDVNYNSNTLNCTIVAPANDTMQIRFSGLLTGTSEDVTVKITRNGVLL